MNLTLVLARTPRILVSSGLTIALLTGCEAETGAGEPSAEQGKTLELPSIDTSMVYEFERWRDDFPYTLHVPPRRIGLWYDRTAQQALEKVVHNLSGLCTQTAWFMSKEFFGRHLEETGDLLIEKLDETQRKPHGYDHAENILGVIGLLKSSAFADVLVRTAAHEHPGIRRAAFRALVNAGDEAAVLEIGKGYDRMSRVETVDWIKAMARHLSDQELFPRFREMMTEQRYADVFEFVFDEATKLDPKRAARLFDPMWLDMVEDLRLHVAGIMHAAGDERGTVRLRHALELPIKIPKRKMVAVQGAAKGDASPMLNELLALTNEDIEDLNLRILHAVRKIPGQLVDDTILTMTDESKPYEIRQYALLTLAERGKTAELDALVDTIRREPEGNKYRNAIADLVGARYGKAVPVLLDRMKKGARTGEIFYLKMIARINRKESFAALREVFLRPEYVYPWRTRYSNVTFLGVQFANLSSCAPEMLQLLKELPKDDYRRRAAMMHTLANLAGSRSEDSAFSDPIYAALRERVFDVGEFPQVRILALDYLRKDLRIGDAMELRARLQREKTAMRQYLSDYLFEFF